MIAVLATSHLGMVVPVGYKFTLGINRPLTTFYPAGSRETHRTAAIRNEDSAQLVRAGALGV